jgi:Tol biopolymer transport system component
MIREANGDLRILVDGSNPTAASLNLIDVNAPDVSYDATKIVFAGLPAGSYSNAPVSTPGAWRIYVINVDGTGLRQITFSDRNINLSQFGNVASSFTAYDDTDPVWLPDGRIVLSSTRWPSFAMYGGVRTSNLHVVNADGTNLHRITAERNGAERPVVDPLTGKIVYSRWWRNFRLGTNNMATMVAPEGGYIMKDGICAISHRGAECQEEVAKLIGIPGTLLLLIRMALVLHNLLDVT